MKLVKLLSAVAVFTLGFVQFAQAQAYRYTDGGYYYKPYEPYSYYDRMEKRQPSKDGFSVGVDLQGYFADAKSDDFSSNYPGASLNIRYRTKNNWALELGGYQTKEMSRSDYLAAPINQTVTSTSQISGIYADVIGFIPIYDYVDGFLSIGYEHVSVDFTQTLSDDVTETGNGFRFALGTEFFFKSGFSLRGYMRYHTTSPEGAFDGFFSVGLGGRYTF